MKTHIVNESGLGTICKTKNRVVAVSIKDFLNLPLEFQCKKCLSKLNGVTSKHNNTKIKQNSNLLHSPQPHNGASSLV